MRIKWHGHSCFEIGDKMTVVTDPHDGRSLGIKPPSAAADIVLMSHDHSDHNSSKTVRGTHKDVLAFAGDFEHNGLGFSGLQTYHDEVFGAKRGKNIVYLMKMDGISVCHCGDLGDIPDAKVMERIKNVDILMVPVGEVYTMEIAKVLEFIDAVRPRVVIPMHYRVGGLSIPVRPVENFINSAEYEVEHVGSEIDLSADELPSETTIWLFSR